MDNTNSINKEYRENQLLRLVARDFSESPCDETMFALIAQIVARVATGCEVLVPLECSDEIRADFYTVSDGESDWMLMYTDLDALEVGDITKMTYSMPLGEAIAAAFENNEVDGIIINLNFEEVCLGKEELDCILDMLRVRDEED